MNQTKLPLRAYLILVVHIGFLGVLQVIAGGILVRYCRDESLLDFFRQRFAAVNGQELSITPDIIVTAGVLYIISGLLFLISGSGILCRKKKFLNFAMAVCILWVIIGLMGAMVGQMTLVSLVSFVLYPGLFIFYFTRRDVRELFE